MNKTAAPGDQFQLWLTTVTSRVFEELHAAAGQFRDRFRDRFRDHAIIRTAATPFRDSQDLFSGKSMSLQLNNYIHPAASTA